jgi:hypothetical protein
MSESCLKARGPSSRAWNFGRCNQRRIRATLPSPGQTCSSTLSSLPPKSVQLIDQGSEAAVPLFLDRLIGLRARLCTSDCFSLAKSATLRHVQDLLANHRQPLAQPGEISCSTDQHDHRTSALQQQADNVPTYTHIASGIQVTHQAHFNRP